MNQTSFSPRFLLSSNKERLTEALAGKKSATVEAEYGDEVVPGSVVTMAHHGSRSSQPAPCSYKNFCAGLVDEAEVRRIEAVGLSHIDLDALAGCAALVGKKPEHPSFWTMAEFQDLHGRHKVDTSNTSEQDIRRLDAFRSWSATNPMNPERDGSVTDVTDKVLQGIDVITKLLQDDSELLTAGDKYRQDEEQLNRDSFVKASANGVIARVKKDDKFVNHLYSTPDGKPGLAIVSFSPEKGKIVLSFADQPKGKNAIEIMTSILGAGAGGHASIAGSPREKQVTEEDFNSVFEAVVKSVDL